MNGYPSPVFVAGEPLLVTVKDYVVDEAGALSTRALDHHHPCFCCLPLGARGLASLSFPPAFPFSRQHKKASIHVAEDCAARTVHPSEKWRRRSLVKSNKHKVLAQ